MYLGRNIKNQVKQKINPQSADKFEGCFNSNISTKFHVDEDNYGKGGKVRMPLVNWRKEKRDVVTGREEKKDIFMLVVCINRNAADCEGQLIYGDKEGSDTFAVDFSIIKGFNRGINATFYFVDYSKRYHSSLKDDVELDANGFSIRFSFYLTAHMATWARHIRSVDKKERVAVMERIFMNRQKKMKKERK